MKHFIKIHPSDLVAVALTPLASGTVLQVDGQTVTLLEDIPQGHKFALAPIPAGSPLLSAKNCVITPHISWAPLEARQRLMDIAVDNLRAFLAGKTVNAVNL